MEFRQTLHFLGTSLAEFYAESKMGILIHCKHDICERKIHHRDFLGEQFQTQKVPDLQHYQILVKIALKMNSL